MSAINATQILNLNSFRGCYINAVVIATKGWWVKINAIFSCVLKFSFCVSGITLAHVSNCDLYNAGLDS